MKLLQLAAMAAMLLGVGAASADFSVTAPDGRRILLKDDGTWRYQDAGDSGKVEPKDPPQGEAVLRLERKIDRGIGCRLVFSLSNNLPFEIRHIVPYFTVFRPSGVVHETVSVAFQSIRSSDKVENIADFTRITCADVARVQVSGGDRCEMGELHKFSDAKGQCLARIRVAPSDLTRFDK